MTGNATVIRDHYGVPHVYAEELYDLFFANGFVAAEDRLHQMERYRRAALGTLAEIAGPMALEMDLETRRHLYSREDWAGIFGRLDAEHQTLITAYVDGVNHYIEQARRGETRVRLDPRLEQLPEPLRPWEPRDSMALTVHFFRNAALSGGTETEQLRILQWLQDKLGEKEGRDYFDDIFPFNDPGSLTVIPPEDDVLDASQMQHHPYTPYHYDRQQVTMDAGALEARQAHLARLRKDCRVPAGLGSFWWGFNGRKSESGNPILVSAPQMGAFTPAYSHQIHLCGAGRDVRGCGYAGSPGVWLGMNRWITWTGTGSASVLADTFYEVLHPDDPARYVFNGEYRTMAGHIEEVRCKGRKAPVRLAVHESVHGRVVYWDLKNRVALVKKSAAHLRELDTWVAWMDLAKARTVQEFDDTVARGTIAGNMLCADCEGNLAYRQMGVMPIRAEGVDRHLPTPGTGEFEWRGTLSKDEMPHCLNPKNGQIYCWGTKPRHVWPEGVGKGHRKASHAWALHDVLDSRSKYTLESTREVKRVFAQKHNFEVQYRPFLVAALEQALDRDPRFRDALAHLKAWNGLMEDKDGDGWYDAPGLTIFEKWLETLQFNTFYPVFEDKYIGTEPYVTMIVSKRGNGLGAGGGHLLAVLEGDDSKLEVKGRYLVDPVTGETMGRDEAILRSLREALDALAVTFDTPDMAQWLSEVRTFDDPFPLDSVPYRHTGTYEHIVEMTPEGPVGYDRNPPGQSDHPDSPHRYDQYDLLANLTHKPLLFRREDIDKHTEETYDIEFPTRASGNQAPRSE